MKLYNFFVVGVGGQGSVMVSNVLADVGVLAGYDVKKTEVHGMAQRGGSVTTHVRWGEQVFSPVIAKGEVDFLLALEKLEAMRYLDMLRPGATALVGDFAIAPISVSSGGGHYPTDTEIAEAFTAAGMVYQLVPTLLIAKQLRNTRVHNAALLGALAQQMPEILTDNWLTAMAGRVPPSYIEVNRRAFLAGMK